MRTRVKICGITRHEDAAAAVAAGADAVGLVFHPESPRYIHPEAAADIVSRLPAFVCAVGLFLDPDADAVSRVLDRVPLDLLQFHGREPPTLCRAFGRRYIKAVAMAGSVDPLTYAGEFPDAAGIVLDSHAPGEQGGTGATFDWNTIPVRLGGPIILAGGLGPGNVGEAVSRFRPYGVDVSSGVERAPGIKDAQRMTAFIREVQRVDDV